MRRYLYRTIALILIVIISGCEWQNAAEPGSISKGRGSKKRNVILFIGDGMGVAQLYAGMTVYPQSFSLEKFPYSGLCKTYSADNYITDSAASGTAISSGIKTNNGMIGSKSRQSCGEFNY